MPRHIIHKQKVQLQTDMSADVFALQNRVSDLLKNDLPGKMESLFNQISPNGNILRIDKLELNLGIVNKQNLEAEFSKKLIEQLTLVLTEKENYTPTHDNENAIEFIEIDPQQSMVDTLIYFLRHGYLPWSSSIKNIKEWEEELLQTLSEKEWTHIAVIVKGANEELGLRRMSFQFSNLLLEKVLFALLPEIRQNWKPLYADFLLITGIGLSKKGGIATNPHNETWFYSLKAAATSENEQEFITAFVKNCLTVLSTGKTISVEEISLLQQNTQSPNNKQLLYELYKEVADGIATEMIDSKEETSDIVKEKDKLKKETEPGEEGLFVNNCGMVILHPFLQMFFQEIGLLEERIFKNVEAAQRAVLLLHYLATGETEAAEFNLLLEKLLCNVDFEEPVPNYIELTDKEKEESANLLNAIMRHWEPLNRTSIEGLRASFFQREGKLINKETGWLLQVEQKTIDILLDKLPWGIGTIKLPWMNNFLSVEWN